jgi:hypothetical protein
MTAKRFEAFKMLFIDNVPEADVVVALRIRGNPKNKYSQKKLLSAYRESLAKEAKKIIAESDIAEYWP